MNKIVKISEFVKFLVALKGAVIVNLTTLTEVRMRKTGNTLANEKVTKLSTKECQFGYSYSNAVNNRLEKQGGERDFVAEPLAWGEWFELNKIITHKGRFYGRFYLMSNQKPTNLYFVNGKIATPKEYNIIKDFEYVREESARQAESGLTNNQVKPFNVGLESIKAMTVNKIDYEFALESTSVEEYISETETETTKA